jgi:hypothetical protein
MRVLAGTAAVAVWAASVTIALPLPGSAAPVPGSRCDVFPADNIWNTRVDSLPVNPMSARWLRSADAATTNLHPDFGPPSYGIPFNVVGRAHSTVSIDFLYADESDPGPYPFDARTPIEGGSDRHALTVQRGTCMLYELYDARWNGGNPTAGSGAIFDLGSNALRQDSWTSADAAGLPILLGLVRWDEVAGGRVAHAIRFTVGCTRDEHIWPARHDAGVSDPECPPMGARFRLKSDFDLTSFSHKARVILRAMQRYGMFVADNGSNWYFQGTVDDHWRNALLDELKSVPASAFEAVDESPCMVKANSARAACP